jgi:hypothetical protein
VRASAVASCVAVLAVAAEAGAEPPQRAALGYVDHVDPRAMPPDEDDAPPPPRRVDVADAPPRASASSVAFDLSVVTEVPLMVGAQATLELPYGFLLQAELGALPAGYVGAMESVAASASPNVSKYEGLVHDALDGSLVLSLSGGVRPFRDHGLEILGGYTLVSLGGSVTAADALQAATGAQLPSRVPSASVTLRSTLHNVHVGVGWRWVVADHFVIRAQVGYLQTLASSSSLGVSGTGDDAAANAALSAASATVDAALDGIYTRYVKSPTASLSLGYRF